MPAVLIVVLIYTPPPPNYERQLGDAKINVYFEMKKKLKRFKVGDEITLIRKMFLDPLSTYQIDIPETEIKGVIQGWTRTGEIYAREKVRIIGFQEAYIGDPLLFPAFYAQTVAIHCRDKEGKEFYVNPFELSLDRMLRENEKTKRPPRGKLVARNRS